MIKLQFYILLFRRLVLESYNWPYYHSLPAGYPIVSARHLSMYVANFGFKTRG